MAQTTQTRIMQFGGNGWYWEVIREGTYEVIARGITHTHAQARAEAAKVSPFVKMWQVTCH